jgi:hypothetical protein
MEPASLVVDPIDDRRDLVPENCRLGKGDAYILAGDIDMSRSMLELDGDVGVS